MADDGAPGPRFYVTIHMEDPRTFASSGIAPAHTATAIMTPAAPDSSVPVPDHSSPAEAAAVRSSLAQMPPPLPLLPNPKPSVLGPWYGMRRAATTPPSGTRVLPSPDSRHLPRPDEAPTSAQRPPNSQLPMSERARRFIIPSRKAPPEPEKDMSAVDPIVDEDEVLLEAFEDDSNDAANARQPEAEREGDEDVDEFVSARAENSPRNNVQFAGGEKVDEPNFTSTVEDHTTPQSHMQSTANQRPPPSNNANLNAKPRPNHPEDKSYQPDSTAAVQSGNAFDEMLSSQTKVAKKRRQSGIPKAPNYSADEDELVLRGIARGMTTSQIKRVFHLERSASSIRNRRVALTGKSSDEVAATDMGASQRTGTGKTAAGPSKTKQSGQSTLNLLRDKRKGRDGPPRPDIAALNEQYGRNKANEQSSSMAAEAARPSIVEVQNSVQSSSGLNKVAQSAQHPSGSHPAPAAGEARRSGPAEVPSSLQSSSVVEEVARTKIPSSTQPSSATREVGQQPAKAQKTNQPLSAAKQIAATLQTPAQSSPTTREAVQSGKLPNVGGKGTRFLQRENHAKTKAIANITAQAVSQPLPAAQETSQQYPALQEVLQMAPLEIRHQGKGNVVLFGQWPNEIEFDIEAARQLTDDYTWTELQKLGESLEHTRFLFALKKIDSLQYIGISKDNMSGLENLKALERRLRREYRESQGLPPRKYRRKRLETREVEDEDGLPELRTTEISETDSEVYDWAEDQPEQDSVMSDDHDDDEFAALADVRSDSIQDTPAHAQNQSAAQRQTGAVDFYDDRGNFLNTQATFTIAQSPAVDLRPVEAPETQITNRSVSAMNLDGADERSVDESIMSAGARKGKRSKEGREKTIATKSKKRKQAEAEIPTEQEDIAAEEPKKKKKKKKSKKSKLDAGEQVDDAGQESQRTSVKKKGKKGLDSKTVREERKSKMPSVDRSIMPPPPVPQKSVNRRASGETSKRGRKRVRPNSIAGSSASNMESSSERGASVAESMGSNIQALPNANKKKAAVSSPAPDQVVPSTEVADTVATKKAPKASWLAPRQPGRKATPIGETQETDNGQATATRGWGLPKLKSFKEFYEEASRMVAREPVRRPTPPPQPVRLPFGTDDEDSSSSDSNDDWGMKFREMVFVGDGSRGTWIRKE